jgi:2-keto-3-deoxy-6-phosphogluconate aldolase
VNPIEDFLKAFCEKSEVIVFRVLTAEDHLQICQRTLVGDFEVQEITLRSNDCLEALTLSVGTDVISLLQAIVSKQMY